MVNIRYQYIYLTFFALLIYSGKVYSYNNTTERIELPFNTVGNNLTHTFDVKNGYLHYIELLEFTEYSRLEVKFRFNNFDGDALAEGRPGLRIFLRNSNNLMEVLSEGVTVKFSTATELFDVPPGTYRLYILLSYHQECSLCSSYSSLWDELPESMNVSMDISFKKNEMIDHNTWVNDFSSWLGYVGLSRYFSVSNVEMNNNTSSHVNVLETASDTPRISIEFNTNLGNRVIDSAEYYGIIDRDQLEAIEYQFMKDSGLDLWWRMATKISLLSGIKRDKIDISFPLYCASGLFREVSPGKVSAIGSYCKMISGSRVVESFNLRGASQGKNLILQENPDRFPDVVHAVLFDIAEKTGGKIEYLVQSNDYIEAELFGSKGAVIANGEQWERVQISTNLVSRKNDRIVRIFVDGMTASGMGASPPPKSRFTESMEPVHSESLNNFLKKILNEIVNYHD
ncbi:hypothetical protein MN202_04825 [Rheinheimera muenzenbergensis]|uniref:Uncharacterized protein n=1 Tax=Rheinheimera muenzenbergensis TaxID=1193628 RepID=A0ABU8C3Q2_9GAMM